MPGKFKNGVCALAWLAIACGSTTSDTDPHPKSIAPAVGHSGASTAVTIRGDGFLARIIQPAGGGTPTQDTRHRAWLADVPLQDVTWVDPETITATVPAGLPVGAHTLVVENPFGRRGQLENAFSVQSPAALSVAVVAPTSAATSRDFTVAMTVTNTGGSDAVGVTPTALTVAGSAGAVLKTTVSPASATIPAGGTAEFRWTYTAGANTGTLRFTGGANGKDAITGAPIAAAAATSGVVTVSHAALSATIAAAPSTLNVGRTITVTLTISNPGTVTIGNIGPSAPVVTGGTATLSAGPTPASIASLQPGNTATFTWQYQAATAGQLSFSASATGTDASTGSQVVGTPVSLAQVVVQTPAVLSVTSFSATPATVSTGQSFAVTLTVGRTGGASAVISAVTLGALANLSCGSLSGATLPLTLTGSSVTFTWNCSASVAGNYPINATVTWADANLGTSRTLSPSSPTAVTVQTGAGLVVNSFGVAPTTVGVGQPVGVTLTLHRTGGARATVSAVTPNTLNNLACSAVAEPLPVNVTGSDVTFTWSCTASAAGSYPLSVTVTWADANTGVNQFLSPPSPVTVTAQAPAALAVSAFDATPATVSVGQSVAVTLTVNSTGGAGAVISSVTPAALANLSCGAVSGPALPLTLAGANATFTWSCTASAAGSYPLSATVTWADANTGVNQSLSPPSPVTVTAQTPAALAISAFGATPATVGLGESFVATLTVNNTGGAGAVISSVTPAALADLSCGIVSGPGLPLTLTDASATFTWSCTSDVEGTYPLSVDAAWSDVNIGVGQTLTPAAPVLVTVLAAQDLQPTGP